MLDIHLLTQMIFLKMIWPVSPARGKILFHILHPDILYLAGNLVVSTVFFCSFWLSKNPWIEASALPHTRQKEKWKVPLADELIWVLLQALLGSLCSTLLAIKSSWYSSTSRCLEVTRYSFTLESVIRLMSIEAISPFSEYLAYLRVYWVFL